MNLNELEQIINKTWENRSQVDTNASEEILEAIKQTIKLTDEGKIRVVIGRSCAFPRRRPCTLCNGYIRYI